MPHSEEGTKQKINEKKKGSAQEFFDKADMPASPDDIIKNTSEHLLNLTKMGANMYNEGKCSENNLMMKKMMAPLEVTADVKTQIRNLPTSDAIMWYIDTNVDEDYDATFVYCNIYLIEPKSQELILSIGHCMNVFEHEDGKGSLGKVINTGTQERDLVLGTFAKTVLQPTGTTGSPFNVFIGQHKGSNASPREKPQRLMVNNAGLRERILPILKEMGIPKKHVVSMILYRPVNCVTCMKFMALLLHIEYFLHFLHEELFCPHGSLSSLFFYVHP